MDSKHSAAFCGFGRQDAALAFYREFSLLTSNESS
jgi:hypothetical protein